MARRCRSKLLQSGVVLSFTYNDARDWPLAAGGAGHSLVAKDAGIENSALLDYGRNWQPSSYMDGSPGEADPAAGQYTLRLNEIAAHTDLDDPAHPEYDSNDWIELYNAGENTLFLGFYCLSDDSDDLMKWHLPAGSLNPGSCKSFDEISGFHSPYPDGFGIDKAGEQILLSFVYNGEVLSVVDSIRFKGQENGFTIGRIPDGAGEWIACMPTPEAANQARDDQPVISEVMYHSSGDDDLLEYVEIYNPSASAVSLWTMDEGDCIGNWRINGDVEYSFPDYTVISAGERVLLLPFDPADSYLKSCFISQYGVSPAVTMFGPYDGKLSNHEGRITLEKPQAPDAVGDDISWIIVDEMVFFDSYPWSLPPDGMGYALHRTLCSSPAADPASWCDGLPSPGGSSVRRPDLHINLLGLSFDNCLLGLELLADIDYTLESRTNLSAGAWMPCATIKNQSEYTAPRETGIKSRFFRLSR